MDEVASCTARATTGVDALRHGSRSGARVTLEARIAGAAFEHASTGAEGYCASCHPRDQTECLGHDGRLRQTARPFASCTECAPSMAAQTLGLC